MLRFRSQNNAVSSDVQGPRILFLLCVFVLTVIGLVMVYSATSATLVSEGDSAYADFGKQLLYVIVGVAFALVMWRIPYHVWMGRIIWALWAVAIVLLLWTWLGGSSEYGATRWIDLGFFTIQSSEFVKIIFLLVVIHLIYNVHEGLVEMRVGVVVGLITVLLPLLLMYRTQSDLGTTVICACGIVAVMWLGGVSRRVILGIIIAGAVLLLFAIFGTDYRSDRLAVYDPWNDGEDGYGSGYQSIRAFYAISEGGFFGVGLGNSHEKYQYLFASDSDFIFAIIGGELGLVGALAVIALFVLMLFAGLRIASRSGDNLGYMIAGGYTIMIVFQAFLNIGCAIGVFPTTGKPLPFVSSGGSSIVSSMIIVGLIMSVSRDEGAPSIYEQRRADLRIVRNSTARVGFAQTARTQPTRSHTTRTRNTDTFGTPYYSGSEFYTYYDNYDDGYYDDYDRYRRYAGEARNRRRGARKTYLSTHDYARLKMPSRSKETRR